MKRKIVLGLMLCIPMLMFANAYHTFRYVRQENTIRSMDREQRAMIEANKRAIADISRLTSPARVREAAEADPRYHQRFPAEIIYIRRREGARE
ncbi:hypothetical protein [Spirochaeta africana]|uniref:Septum formation initiator n=1 Tax=Spirochaeta africana (strain ATCC 700263 / DSM 8902 / Z-7692) TaxID=889378 RepID=H9UKX7_SPIAZ|nr:hypothetical protein [Spirochaeta africana]AFG38170.1 hypothetical protein Spiaf_2122 [Spirochaeta africana DSM 8902]